SSVGSLTLSAAGKVTQSGVLTITGATTISANNDEVELNSSNNIFGGLVTLNDVSSVIVRGSGSDGSLNIGAIDVSGNNTRSAGRITLEAISGDLIAGDLSANGGTGDGDQNARSGGAISLTAAGSITAEAINAVGSQGNSDWSSRNGGRGGNVAIASTSEDGIVRVGAIDTSGGNGNSNMGGDRHGGSAGAVEITGNTIELNGSIITQGGLRGSNSSDNGKGGNVTLAGEVRVLRDIAINTSYKSSPDGSAERGDVSFSGAVLSQANARSALRITADDVTFGADVGNGSSGRLGAFELYSTTDFNAEGIDFFISSFKSET